MRISGPRACGLGLLGSAMLASVLAGSVAVSAPMEAASAPRAPNPVAGPAGGVSNVTFYYDGTTPLRRDADLSVLGHSSIVVTTPKADPQAAVAAIHSTGAKAYRYVQFYWAPDDAAYQGINLAKHPGWSFCRSGRTASTGRTTGDGTKWRFIDANEKAVRARFRQILAGFKAEGWDGVMFDRGQAATQYAADAAGRPVWDRPSSCTGDPYKRGATFADAFINMLGLAHAEGLQAMVNNGRSPFDVLVPMRPDPRNAHCSAARWSRCGSLSDVWSKVDLVLNEAAARPEDKGWRPTFVANQRSERDARHGRRTVALITTATLRGAQNQTASKVYYQWARIKLFDLAVGVNTGNGGCGPNGSASGVCNRYGTYPRLADIDFGKPLGPRPWSQGCTSGSEVRCVWVRRYLRGTDVINVRGVPLKGVRIALGRSTCRYVYDVYHRAPLAGNRCVKAVRMNLPAWSGRPLKTSTTRW